MAGSFFKLRIVMAYENKRADLLSVQYSSQRIAWSARICRAPNVIWQLQRAPSLLRIAVMRTIIRPPKSLRDDSDRVFLTEDGQPGSYRFVRRISTEKRPSVYRIDSLPDVSYPGNYRDTFWEIRGAVLEFAGFFQPTTQPTESMSYMNFRVLWQSPRSCMLL